MDHTFTFSYRLAIYAVAMLCLLFPATAFSQSSTITCHCFQDRSFDPSRPGAADSYFLATAQNTLLAAAFDRPKRDVVMAKQTGTANEDLWIAYRVSAVSELAPRRLLDEKRRAGHWQPVLQNLKIDLGLAETEMVSGWDEVLARAIFDQVLLEHEFSDEQTLEELRLAGSNQQEALLAVLLAQAGSFSAMDYFQQARNKQHPWGELLAENGLAENLGDVVRNQVAKATN